MLASFPDSTPFRMTDQKLLFAVWEMETVQRWCVPLTVSFHFSFSGRIFLPVVIFRRKQFRCGIYLFLN